MQKRYQDGAEDGVTAPSEVGVDRRPAVLHSSKQEIGWKRGLDEKRSNQTQAWRGMHRQVRPFSGITSKMSESRNTTNETKNTLRTLYEMGGE